MANPAEPDKAEVLQKLQSLNQDHIVAWFESLVGGERERLLDQLAGLDLTRLQQLRALIQTPPTETSFDDMLPAPVERVPLGEADSRREDKVIRLGAEALQANRVAALTVAGGQGTRLRYDHPKGMFPISPIRQLSLFALFSEQIRAARRRYGCRMPWLLMTSPSTDAETRAFFSENAYFGLGEDTVHFFVQRTNPILDARGRLLLAEADKLLVGPDGHGGVYDALVHSGLTGVLREGGQDLISYFQVDNPLVTVADPRFLGYHVARRAEFSCKVVAKRDPGEGLGVAVIRAGRPAVVEYIDVPEELAQERLPSGKLRYLYGSIAIHILNVSFAERVAREHSLPWHVARKQYEVVRADGRKALTEPGGCRKYERFVFDALPFAANCAFVEVDRWTEFSPVKNATGQDSPDLARAHMQRMWLTWLREAGAKVEVPHEIREPMVEISPMYALDPEELKERVEPGWEPTFPLLLGTDTDAG
jgi:UDP-N-acetylglucosamine/UDP-N-acetylgalactosamine diphosphorylase